MTDTLQTWFGNFYAFFFIFSFITGFIKINGQVLHKHHKIRKFCFLIRGKLEKEIEQVCTWVQLLFPIFRPKSIIPKHISWSYLLALCAIQHLWRIVKVVEILVYFNPPKNYLKTHSSCVCSHIQMELFPPAWEHNSKKIFPTLLPCIFQRYL